MHKLLSLLSIIVLFTIISGCSKDSSSKKWDYATGLKKGDIVEFRILPGISGTSSVTVNNVIYSIDYMQSVGSKSNFLVTNTTSPLLTTFTAYKDNQMVYLHAGATGSHTKILIQIVVNGTILKEGYVDNTYQNSLISIPDGLIM